MFFPDGSQQQASLELDAQRLEDMGADRNNHSHYPVLQEPSARFPISTSLSRQPPPKAARVFVYTAVPFDRLQEPEAPAEGSEGDIFSTPKPGGRAVLDHSISGMSEGSMPEDWQSAHGHSDGEPDAAQRISQ